MKVTQKGNVDLETVALSLDAKTLGDVVITSSIAVARKTPVAVTTLAPEFIEEKLGTQEFPEILKSTPVYMLPSKVVHTVIQKSTCVVSRAKISLLW